MSKRITGEELRTIRERADKATEGEWRYYPSRLYSHDMICVGDFDGQNIAEIRSRESDGEFIAHARQDIPKLLAEIIRLRSIADDLLYSSNLSYDEIERYEKLIRGDSE